jgi:hypothetical protein
MTSRLVAVLSRRYIHVYQAFQAAIIVHTSAHHPRSLSNIATPYSILFASPSPSSASSLAMQPHQTPLHLPHPIKNSYSASRSRISIVANLTALILALTIFPHVHRPPAYRTDFYIPLYICQGRKFLHEHERVQWVSAAVSTADGIEFDMLDRFNFFDTSVLSLKLSIGALHHDPSWTC